ncbi:MAG: methylenetetrahydrofolate reductase C-terminal domain-containing protein [Lentisphaeria bacterium]|nr:methylenetetrahydrofolate reductase C-terminal domain-containing protein [Lentisphaeria bacterium]
MNYPPGIQLEMNFDGPKGNRFKEKLNNGVFQLIVEVAPPTASIPLVDAAARFKEIEYIVSAKQEIPAALVFLDKTSPPDNAADPVRFASELCQTDRDRHLLCVSGKNRTLSETEKMLGHAANEGFRNILAVSGGSVPEDTPKKARSRIYTESIHILQSIKEKFPDLLNAGCAVNPYCYIPETVFPQYAKLAKKISAGAAFAVTQYGWDMHKLQELTWSLNEREVTIPLIARLQLLTPDKAEEICADKVPGVRISPDLEVMLRREMTHSLAQFEAAQWRRLQIHAAGARFLGYSGIQISGAERPEQVNILLNRIAEALKEFTSFEEWIAAYNDYYARLDMAPYPYRFYKFKNLLTSASFPEQLEFNPAEMTELSKTEKFKFNLSQYLLGKAHQIQAAEKRLTKKILVSCRSCQECRLPLTGFVCPENCPKGFANGPCGSTKVDGRCEMSNDECIFSKQIRIAAHTGDYATLEETFIPPVAERK